MGMTMECKTVVMAKQVPDTSNISGEVMRPDGTVNRGKLPAVFNPDDKVAWSWHFRCAIGSVARSPR